MNNAVQKIEPEQSVSKAENISDIYIPVREFDSKLETGDPIPKHVIDDAWFYANGKKVTQNVKDVQVAKDFTIDLIQALNRYTKPYAFTDERINDVQVKVQSKGCDFFCRVHKELNTSFGIMIVCRLQPDKPPSLSEMALPFMMYDLLMHKLHEKGGLIIAVAGLGAGKTTTVSATVRSRLTEFGGLGVSIEDPPEHNLKGDNDGRWGPGKIIQKSVMSSNNESFADAVRNSLRMFPATPGNLLFLGEIRDSDTAEHALNAAANGSLVLATVHGNDVASGLDRFLSYTVNTLGKELSYNLLRDSLRLSIFQGIESLPDSAGEGMWGNASPKVTMLHNMPWGGSLKDSIVAGFDPKRGIKKGLADVTNQQKNNIAMGASLLHLIVKAIIQKAPPRKVLEVLHKFMDHKDISKDTFKFTETDFHDCCKYVMSKGLTKKVATRLLRPGCQWQTEYEPEPFIKLRSSVVSKVLDGYYRG